VYELATAYEAHGTVTGVWNTAINFTWDDGMMGATHVDDMRAFIREDDVLPELKRMLHDATHIGNEPARDLTGNAAILERLITDEETDHEEPPVS